MTAEEIKKLALTGSKGESPDDWQWFSAADKLLWYQCNEIYGKFRTGAISQEEGRKEITKSISEWEANKSSAERSFAIHKRLARLYADIEVKASAFSRNPCIDTAKAIIDELYGHTMKEVSNNG